MPIAALPLRRKMDLEVLQICCREHWGKGKGKSILHTGFKREKKADLELFAFTFLPGV